MWLLPTLSSKAKRPSTSSYAQISDNKEYKQRKRSCTWNRYPDNSIIIKRQKAYDHNKNPDVLKPGAIECRFLAACKLKVDRRLSRHSNSNSTNTVHSKSAQASQQATANTKKTKKKRIPWERIQQTIIMTHSCRLRGLGARRCCDAHRTKAEITFVAIIIGCSISSNGSTVAGRNVSERCSKDIVNYNVSYSVLTSCWL